MSVFVFQHTKCKGGRNLLRLFWCDRKEFTVSKGEGNSHPWSGDQREKSVWSCHAYSKRERNWELSFCMWKRADSTFLRLWGSMSSSLKKATGSGGTAGMTRMMKSCVLLMTNPHLGQDIKRNSEINVFWGWGALRRSSFLPRSEDVKIRSK